MNRTVTKAEPMEENGIIAILKQRCTVYKFLKRVYEKELDTGMLLELPRNLKTLVLSIELLEDKKKRDSIDGLLEFTSKITRSNVSEYQLKLAADYARLFLSINKIPPHPSESVYREGALMQASRDEVLELYWNQAVDISEEFTEPEDHIAVELSFMAQLCEKAIRELESGSNGKTIELVRLQNDFLEKHLLKWVPRLVKDINIAGKTPFYKGIANITGHFLMMDRIICGGLADELKKRRAN